MNTINPSQLPQIRWQNQNVITTELLAKCYEAKTIQIQQNYLNNKSRFIEGKHFFKLEGNALKTFKKGTEDQSLADQLETMFKTAGFDMEFRRLDNIESVKIANNVNSLMPWTEKGAARHSKILDTEKAWDMFDQLEEAYFHPERRATQPSLPSNDYAILQNKYITLLEQENNRLKNQPVPPFTQTSFGAMRAWTPEEDALVRTLKAQGLGYTRIGYRLGRSGHSIKHRYARLMAQGGV